MLSGAVFALLASRAPCAAATASNAPAEVVQFRNPTSVALAAWPVRVGAPFGRGERRDAANLTLSSGSRVLATQAKVLSRWDDGSIRWAMLDAVTDLAAAGGTKLRLGSGASASPSRKAIAEDKPDRVVVDTGTLRFEIPKHEFAIIDKLRVDTNEPLNGKVSSFLKVDGKLLAATPPRSVRILDNGPARATIELRGDYGGGFEYVVRVEAYGGRRQVRVLHTFVSHTVTPQSTLQQATIRLPLRPDANRGRPDYRLGREAQAPAQGVLPEAGLTAVQMDNQEFAVAGNPGSGHLDGTLQVGQSGSGVALVARWFWQQYPQGFEISAEQLDYHIWAPQGGATTVGSGSAKTHEVVLLFGADAALAMEHPEAIAAPVIGRVEAQRTQQSRALRNSVSLVATPSFLPGLEAATGRYIEGRGREVWDDRDEATCAPDSKIPERRRTGAYGMWNWGDWNYPGYHDDTKGCDAWGNLEYDLTQVMALGFAATGDPRMLEEMVASARHFMDVDRIHFSAKHPEWVGMNHPKNPRHFSFELGGVDLGHTWTEGLLSYAMITGDELAVDAASGIADYLAARATRPGLKGNPRQWGWPQIALIAAYEATGERRYRDAATVYARGGMAAYPPALGKDWKIGILAESLAYTHSVTGDPKIGDWLTRYAAVVAQSPAARDARLLPALAYVGKRNHQPEYTKIAETAVANLQFGNWGKPLTIAGRIGFSILGQR